MGWRAGLVVASAIAAMGLAPGPALAQKPGGTLRIYHRDTPSASIHEEATISTVEPFMGVFNNLVPFDQHKPRPEILQTLPGYSLDVEKSRAEARGIMEGLGYSEATPLKVKVSTRNIAVYRDPAVRLIDQLKKIHIDGELEVVDTSTWHAKVRRGEYSVGLNLTGVGVDDPDVNVDENYSCESERNLTRSCNREVDALIDKQSQELDPETRKDHLGDRAQACRGFGPSDHPLRPPGHLLAARRALCCTTTATTTTGATRTSGWIK